MTTKTYFYQSAIVNYVEVDFDNPLHQELFLMFDGYTPWSTIAPQRIAEATKLMKKIPGFKPSVSLNNTVAWGSDIWLAEKEPKDV